MCVTFFFFYVNVIRNSLKELRILCILFGYRTLFCWINAPFCEATNSRHRKIDFSVRKSCSYWENYLLLKRITSFWKNHLLSKNSRRSPSKEVFKTTTFLLRQKTIFMKTNTLFPSFDRWLTRIWHAHVRFQICGWNNWLRWRKQQITLNI